MSVSLRRFVLLRTALLCVAIMLTACSSLQGLKAPEVSVADLSLSGGNFFEQRFKLTLRVTNPNDRDLVLEGLSFDLLVADKQIARGLSNRAVTLPRFGEALMEVDGTAQTLSLLRQITEMTDRDGKLNYRIKGEAFTRDYGRIPFDHKGDTTLPWNGSRAKPPSERI